MKTTTKHLLLLLITSFSVISCGIYSFSGISISPDVKTFEVRKFNNEATIIEAGLDRTFTVGLQDFILNQTNLDLTTNNGDIVYEGEITQFYIAPNNADTTTSTAENRLTIAVRVRFFDTKNTENDLEKTFSFFFDYDSADSLTGATADEAFETIFERIHQDIVTATLAKW